MRWSRRNALLSGMALFVAAGAAFVVERSISAPPPSSETATETLTGLLLAGCGAVAHGRCAVGGDATLRLWIPDEAWHATPDAPTVTVDDVTVEVSSPETVAGGHRYTLHPPRGGRLSVATDRGQQSWSLVERRSTPRLDELEQARRRGDAGVPAALEALRADPSTTPADRLRIEGMLARIALRRGDVDEAIEQLTLTSRRARDEDRLSVEIDDSLALAYVLLTRKHQVAAAQATLDALRDASPYAEGVANLDYYRGLVASARGDFRSAMRHQRRASRTAARIGLDLVRTSALDQLSLSLSQLGRAEEALAIHESLASPRGATPCDAVAFAANRAWLELRAGERAKAASRLGSLGALDRRGGLDCRDPFTLKNALLTSASVAIEDQRWDDAATLVDRVGALPAENAAVYELWMLDLRGRIAQHAGDLTQALAAFDDEAGLARDVGDPEALWRASYGRGLALEARGDVEQAIAALVEAEDVLDELLPTVPLSQGPDRYLGERSASARRLVRLLVERGRLADAMQRARGARLRALAALSRVGGLAELSAERRARWDAAVERYRAARRRLEAQRDEDWRRSKQKLARSAERRNEELAAMAAALDEAYASLDLPRFVLPEPTRPRVLTALVIHDDEGWLLLFEMDDRRRAAALDPEAAVEDTLARALATTLDAWPRAELVRLLVAGDSRLDLHALRMGDGEPLIAQVPVAYGVDVAISRQPPAVERTLVVGDPNGDLPGARAEVALVANLVPNEEVVTGADARRSLVLQRLAEVSSLHFAGHAAFSGASSYESGLRMADAFVTIGDVLTAPRVPRRIVLSACDAARAPAESLVAGWGLAQAFVVKGATAVVGPSRRVTDQLGAAMTQAYYRALETTDDPAAALARAQRAIAAHEPDSDWPAYRVVTP